MAAFSYRYDVHLVPDLLTNLAPICDGWVALDDRGASAEFSDEPGRRRALLAAARGIGADWILAIDPDERCDDQLADRIGTLTTDPGVIWAFDCREMFGPGVYRTDGIWGRRWRQRLFPVRPDLSAGSDSLHGAWCAYSGDSPPVVRRCGLAFYHLRMASAARRTQRRRLYAHHDPHRRHQKVGYDYLDDERGQILVPLAEGEGFSPPFIEDGGLWAPPLPPHAGEVGDPPEATLRFIGQSKRQGGHSAAAFRAADLSRSAPEDRDLARLAAALALRAGELGLAGDVLSGGASCLGDLILLSRWRQRAGDPDGARAAALQAAALSPRSQTAAQAVARCRGPDSDLSAPDALWRRWTPPDARLHEGDSVAAAPIAVVVIGLGAPPDLAEAVASLRDQGHKAEIVVVNSGGGDARARLAPHLDAIRLIETDHRMMVGAARNAGIDASLAPVVAFLASDCIAAPGWLAGRLRHHAEGADAVASPIGEYRVGPMSSLAASAWLHWRRWPGPQAPMRARYGLSYARHLFDDWGYFPSGLRIGEDTVLNERLWDNVRVDWAPDVVTLHRFPRTPLALWRDMRSRGYRRAQRPPLSALVRGPSAEAEVAAHVEARLEALRPVLARHERAVGAKGLVLRALVRLAARADRSGIRQAVRVARAAAVHLARAAADPSRAVEHCASAIRLTPQDSALYLALGRAHLAAGQTDEAIVAFRTGLSIDPENAPLLAAAVAALTEAKRPGEAADLAEATALLAPASGAAWQGLYRAALAEGDLERALFAASAALWADPATPGVHGLVAQAHGRRGDKAAASRRLAMRALLLAEPRPATVAD